MSLARALRALPAALAGGTGLWLACGAVAPEPAGRVGVFAPWWLWVAFVCAPLLRAAWSDEGLRRTRVWWIGLFGCLAWLPWGELPALLMWQGPLGVALVLCATGVLLLPSPVPRSLQYLGRLSPVLQAIIASAIAFVCYTGAAWCMAPVLPAGDEPHYLIITQSLLHDHDLAIENNHQRREYLAYFDHAIRPDYLRRGVNGAIYSIHAPGLSALVAPAFAVAGYQGAVVMLALLAAIGTGLVWRAGWHLTQDAAAAWIGWASVSLSAPFFFHAFTVYPDGPGAVLVMVAVYAMFRLRAPGSSIAWVLLASGAVALLPWLHTRFAMLAGVLGTVLLVRVWQGRAPRWRVVAYAAIPLASVVLWLSYFYVLYGTPNPAAPYGGYTQSSLGNAGRGLSGLLIDQQFGLLTNAPIYLIACAGLVPLWRLQRRFTIELAATVLPYVIAAASYHMWWGGHSAPARFLVPVLLPAGVAVAVAWKRSGPAGRSTAIVLLVTSVALTATLAVVDRGALVYDTRDGYARWLEWIAPAVRLALAVPSLFRAGGPLAAAWLQAFAWGAAGLLAWGLLRWRATRGGRPTPGVVAAAAIVGMMSGASLGWHVQREHAVDEGSALWDVARAAARPGAMALRLPAFQVGPAPDLLRNVRLVAPERLPGVDGTLFTARAVPAGEYAIDVLAARPGLLEVSVGRRLPPIAVVDPVDAASAPRVRLPFGAASLSVEGVPPGAETTDEVALVPLKLMSGSSRLARAGIRFGSRTLWLLDDNAWAEPGGLWTRDTRAATIAVDGAGAPTLRLRNGAVPNTVTITSGSWRTSIALSSGEVREIRVPASGTSTPITIAAGRSFRPIDHDPGSGDARMLGVWVEVGG